MSQGTLFYVIGASGAGKDSICAGARAAMSGESPVFFAHRYITRPADAGGENHVALSAEEFRTRKEMNLFAMSWESHGNHYGIGTEIDLWLERGAGVVVNGSRAYLDTAAERYPNLVPIHITVCQPVLRRRLLERGRESIEQIEKRLRRTAELSPVAHPATRVVRNDATLSEAVQQFLEVVQDR